MVTGAGVLLVDKVGCSCRLVGNWRANRRVLDACKLPAGCVAVGWGTNQTLLQSVKRNAKCESSVDAAVVIEPCIYIPMARERKTEMSTALHPV